MGELTTIVGFIAGLVTTAANLPQVWKTYRAKSGEGLSFRMLLTLAVGLVLWIIYGIMSKSTIEPLRRLWREVHQDLAEQRLLALLGDDRRTVEQGSLFDSQAA
jgi:uncharacterized protein with PQ loop repeat